MNKYKKPVINEDLLRSNPLTAANFLIPVRKRKDHKIFLKKGDLYIANEYDIEAEAITKIYKKPVNRTIIMKLSACARSLKDFITFELEYGKDYLWINRVRYMEEAEITSVNTYKAAIFELADARIISPSVIRGVYWINPRLFFCGSRVNKYPDNVIITSSDEDKNPISITKSLNVGQVVRTVA